MFISFTDPVLNSISLTVADSERPNDSDRWKTGHLPVPGGVSDAGSGSLSNFSSGDGLSTFSQLSNHFSYFSSGDGLSTPTHMGSTTRLVHSNKSPVKVCKFSVYDGEYSTCVSVVLMYHNYPSNWKKGYACDIIWLYLGSTLIEVNLILIKFKVATFKI